MLNKKILTIFGIIVVLVVFSLIYSENKSELLPTKTEDLDKLETVNATKPKTSTKSKSVNPNLPIALETKNYPDLEFIDKRLSFDLKGYDRVKIFVEKVVFGRGEATISTGCSGVPNADFATYLYPGSGICISTEKVDGAPRGIIAVHALIENNGSFAFGGNSKTITLHYLRTSPDAKINHRFANILSGMASYSIEPFSSKEVILSYLVPEDQNNFDLLFDYTGVGEIDFSKSIYTYSNGGINIDFTKKSLLQINPN